MFFKHRFLTDNEPQQRSLVAPLECRIEPVDYHQGNTQLDSTSCEEDAQQLGHRPFICKVAHDVCLERVEGMGERIVRQFRDIGKKFCHVDMRSRSANAS